MNNQCPSGFAKCDGMTAIGALTSLRAVFEAAKLKAESFDEQIGIVQGAMQEAFNRLPVPEQATSSPAAE
jgi:hypothetical protein